jgi:hypothetical protein
LHSKYLRCSCHTCILFLSYMYIVVFCNTSVVLVIHVYCSCHTYILLYFVIPPLFLSYMYIVVFCNTSVVLFIHVYCCIVCVHLMWHVKSYSEFQKYCKEIWNVGYCIFSDMYIHVCLTQIMNRKFEFRHFSLKMYNLCSFENCQIWVTPNFCGWHGCRQEFQ